MPKVSIVIPTRNEKDNIINLLKSIKLTLQSIDHDILVVDDSTDNTAELASDFGAIVIKGQHKGLGQAIIDGIQKAETLVVLVMDADLSHRPEDIPGLLNPILEHGIDMTIGSRYVNGGGTTNWNIKRLLKSKIGSTIMQIVTGVKDSNSGFFAFRKSILDGVTLNADSWKIMLEVLYKGKITSKLEVPIQFRERNAGVSKNNSKEALKQSKHLIKLTMWKTNRFWKYVSASGVGTIVTYLVSWICTSLLGIHYLVSLTIATALAVVVNFTLNSKWTFASKGKSHNESDYEWYAFYKGQIWQKRWKQLIAKTVKQMAGNSGYTLDIGCGSSPCGILVNHSDYVGLDIDSNKISYMSNKNLVNAKYITDSAGGLPFGNNKFDTVLMIEALEHLDSVYMVERAISEISRVLKNGGQAIIAIPNSGSWQNDIQESLYKLVQPKAYKHSQDLGVNKDRLVELCNKYNLVYQSKVILSGCDLIYKCIKLEDKIVVKVS